eukprot:TRINITY_DN3647_c0_g1_i1.p1 TRINITY_DN3647_c0_g1~~TRINITY_DN3647_c0_g1_i1.p1  ORF type:complete len:112 (+),score=8.19 TRINITY_DN3647_c0_g1_i1:180-515(+)
MCIRDRPQPPRPRQASAPQAAQGRHRPRSIRREDPDRSEARVDDRPYDEMGKKAAEQLKAGASIVRIVDATPVCDDPPPPSPFAAAAAVPPTPGPTLIQAVQHPPEPLHKH